MSLSEPYEVNQTQLSGVLGLTTRQIRRLEAEGLPVRAKGASKTYSLPDAVQWYVARKAEEAARDASPGELDRARIEKAQADARLRQLDLDRTMARLVPADQVGELLEEACAVISSRIQSMPGRYGHVVNPGDPPTGQDGLETVAAELLEALSASFGDEGEAAA